MSTAKDTENVSVEREKMSNVLKMTSLAKVTSRAVETKLTQSKEIYSDEMLDRVVVKEYLRFLPALSHHHVVRRESLNKHDAGFCEDHWAAALFLDISGFTRLSQALGAEKTKLHCNKFFSLILKVIAYFNGDTLKFLGDAMFVLWPLSANARKIDRDSACQVAAECAAAIMAVGNYDADDIHQDTHLKYHVKLRLHCGLACGRIKFLHVGDERRVEALMGGEPIAQLTNCESQAKQGQVVMSPQFRSHLNERSIVAQVTVADQSNFRLCWEKLVETGIDKKTTTGKRGLVSLPTMKRVEHLLSTVTVCEESVLKQYKNFHKLRRYVGSTRDGASNETRASSNDETTGDVTRSRSPTEDQARWKRERLRMLNAVKCEAETARALSKTKSMTLSTRIRQRVRSLVHEVARDAADNDMLGIVGSMNDVTTIFVQLDDLIPYITAGDVDMVQKAFLALTGALRKRGGVVRQFVQDDKGCVGIGAFGVAGYSYIDNEARAMRCAFEIVEAFEKLELSCCCGVATGSVFCGLVGAQHRCEWAMLGPSVNLAARLMGKAKRGQVLVEEETYMQTINSADGEFTFLKLKPVDAKGYASPVPVFSPNWVSRQRGLKEQAVEVTRMKRLHHLDIFSQLVIKLAAVVAFSHHEVKDPQSSTHDAANESERPRNESVFSLAKLMFALSALGHASDMSKLHDALTVLSKEPALISPASLSKAQKARKNSYAMSSESSRQRVEASEEVNKMSADTLKLVRKALRSHFLFASKSDTALDEIAVEMRLRELKSKAYLFKQGDPSDMYYILEHGELTLRIDGRDVKTFSPGASFGELSIMFNIPRTASIWASSKTGGVRLWCLEREIFQRFVNVEYKFAHGDIRRKVYGQILSKQRMEMHSICATFLLNQQSNRQQLRGRFQHVVRKIVNLNRWNKAALLAIARKDIETPEKKSGKNETKPPSISLAKSKGEESFDGGGGMHIRVCQHLLQSDMEVSVIVEHIQKLADVAAEHRDVRMSVEWYQHLLEIAFGLDPNNADGNAVLGYFYCAGSHVPSALSKGNEENRMMIKSRPSFVQRSSVFQTRMLSEDVLQSIEINPHEGYERQKSGKRKVAPRLRSSTAYNETDASHDETKRQTTIRTNTLVHWILSASLAHMNAGHKETSFNLSQVALIYLGLPLIPIDRNSGKGYFVSKYIGPMRMKQAIKRRLQECDEESKEHVKRAYFLAFDALHTLHASAKFKSDLLQTEYALDMAAMATSKVISLLETSRNDGTSLETKRAEDVSTIVKTTTAAKKQQKTSSPGEETRKRLYYSESLIHRKLSERIEAKQRKSRFRSIVNTLASLFAFGKKSRKVSPE